jgi:hypothetical protein
MGKITGTGLLKLADGGLFLSYVCAVIAVYILDFIFFGSLVAFGPLTFVFVLIGFVLRSGAVFAGIVLQKLKGHDEIKGDRAMIRALWIFCVVACLASAINFFAAGHAHKASESLMGGAVAETTVASKGERISAIQAEIDGAKAEMDESIAEVNRSIDAILDDGVPGISASDNQSLMSLRAEIKEYRDDFKALRVEKEAAISAIRAEKETALVDEAVADNTDDTWQVFIWLGQNMPFGNSDGWSTWGLFYFAMLIEAIAAFGLGAYVAIHHYLQRIIAHHAIEEDVRSIHHEAELTSARIRAKALKKKLAREANAAALAMVEDDPELHAAKAAVNWLASLMVPEPVAEPEPQPANDKPPEMTPEEFRLWKSQQAKKFYQEALKAGRIPVDDHLKSDIARAAE